MLNKLQRLFGGRQESPSEEFDIRSAGQHFAPYGNGARAEDLAGHDAIPEGTTTTILDLAAGTLEIEHGVQTAPDPETRTSGRYFLRAELEVAEAAGEGDIGFVQTVKAGESGGEWSTDRGDRGISTDERALRTDPETGMRVDRGNSERYKTPFYGTKKEDDEIVPKDHNNSLGSFGGATVRMRDRPTIPFSYNKKMTFTTTAMAVDDGRELGTFAWGFDHGRRWEEFTPTVLDAGHPLFDERDRAMDRWNEHIALEGSGIDPIPGRGD
ncbi:MAG: hypothetical protein EA397_17435 [Deltaproteobacteria bacterium]|nr:MAG: hypothetical protein EA397_17435 [Deltaproteobacteria bacterium]